MSYTTSKQRKSGKMLITTLVIFFILFIALLATGCSVPATATPDPAASAATTPSEEPKQDPPAVPVFGETVSYEDGTSISVSNPAPYTPTEMAAGMVDGQQVVVFELVFTNNTTEPYDPSLIYATASSGGVEASGVFDTSNNIGFPPTTSVLPGATVKWQQAWSVADPASITLEVALGFSTSTIFTTAK